MKRMLWHWKRWPWAKGNKVMLWLRSWLPVYGLLDSLPARHTNHNSVCVGRWKQTFIFKWTKPNLFGLHQGQNELSVLHKWSRIKSGLHEETQRAQLWKNPKGWNMLYTKYADRKGPFSPFLGILRIWSKQSNATDDLWDVIALVWNNEENASWKTFSKSTLLAT